MSKLSKERFRLKNVHLKKMKMQKMPIECETCEYLKSFVNEITTYYYCSEVNSEEIIEESKIGGCL